MPSQINAAHPLSPSQKTSAPVLVQATFRFYEELNDFLPSEFRRHDFEFACPPDAPVRHIVETLGVPHTEIELILINGASVNLEQRIRPGDRVAVYPKFEAFDIRPLLRLRPYPLRSTRFVADAHLGALARGLRMAGFDTVYANPIADDEIERLAETEKRIVLTRDRELLKRRGITHGCYVRALTAEAQLEEIVRRLDLASSMRPFSLCMECNAPLRPVDKEFVADRLPERIRERHTRFSTCDVCQRVYWEGTHWQKMRRRLAALGAASGQETTTGPGEAA